MNIVPYIILILLHLTVESKADAPGDTSANASLTEAAIENITDVSELSTEEAIPITLKPIDLTTEKSIELNTTPVSIETTVPTLDNATATEITAEESTANFSIKTSDSDHTTGVTSAPWVHHGSDPTTQKNIALQTTASAIIIIMCYFLAIKAFM